METQLLSLKTDFVALVEQGMGVLSCAGQQIQACFCRQEVTAFPLENLLEVVFDLATLTCVLDGNGHCVQCYLFLHDDELLSPCVEVCRSRYAAVSPNLWFNSFGFIRAEQCDNSTFFTFHRLSKTTSYAC